MDQDTTIITLGITVFTTVFANYRSRQPRELGKSWHVPWDGIQFMGILLALLLIRHLLSLSGNDLPPMPSRR